MQSDTAAPPTAPDDARPVIRTYRARDRRSADSAYRIDAAQAKRAGWHPVAHRWTEGWDGTTLEVVFERRAAAARPPVTGPSTTASPGGSRATTTTTVAGSAARAHARAAMTAIDLHCAGEPLRLIRSGVPQPPFAPIGDRRRWAMTHAEDVRRVLMHEPRGHRDMYGAILLPPFRADADVAVLFMHNEGWSTMCGHGVIAITTALLEEQLYPATEPETEIRYEVPAGRVVARAAVTTGAHGGPQVSSVRFRNVPSFLAERDVRLRPDGLAESAGAAEDDVLSVDIAFGGAFYAIVEAADLGLRVIPSDADRLREAGAAITELVRRDHRPTHPADPDLGFVYGTIIVDGDPASSPDGRARDADLRNVAIFADAEVDRSPCGSGTSAILAQRFERGTIAEGQPLRNASITGEVFIGRVEGRTQVGGMPAVDTSVEGSAYVTGYGSFVVDERDPLGGGFLLG